MKNFDIENLERKNIYKVSDTLFDDVQKNVMNAISINKEETILKPNQGKIIKLNWWMAAAASLVLIFGFGWMFSGLFTTSNNDKIDTLVKVELPHNADESVHAYNVLKSDVTSIEVENSRKDTHSTNVKSIASTPEIKNKNIKTVSLPSKEVNEEEMNAYLDVLSNKEISEIAQNSVSDVYLDLYN